MNDQESRRSLVRFPGEILGSIHQALLLEHDPGESARLLRAVGLESGSAFYDQLVGFLADRYPDSPARPDALDPDSFWARLSDFFRHLGWGELEQRRLHAGVVALDSQRWIESDSADPRHPGCQFTTGMLAELLRLAAGRDVAVLEVECRGAGADRCSFLVGNEEALGLVFERLREGEPYAEAVASLA